MENDIKSMIMEGFSEIAPDCLDEIMAAEPKRFETEEELMGVTEQKTFARKFFGSYRMKFTAAVAAAVVLICALSFQLVETYKIVDKIFLDVNPSIVVGLNRSGNVVKVWGVNEDGENVVSSAKAKLKDIKDPADTVKVLVEEIDEEGYFKDGEADVLLSLEYDNEPDDKVLKKVVKSVDKYTKEKGIKKKIVVQKFKTDKTIEKDAQDKGVSTGKYKYIKTKSEEVDIDVDEYKDKSIKEINDYVEKNTTKKEKSGKNKSKEKDITYLPETPPVTETLNSTEKAAETAETDTSKTVSPTDTSTPEVKAGTETAINPEQITTIDPTVDPTQTQESSKPETEKTEKTDKTDKKEKKEKSDNSDNSDKTETGDNTSGSSEQGDQSQSGKTGTGDASQSEGQIPDDSSKSQTGSKSESAKSLGAAGNMDNTSQGTVIVNP